MPVDIREIKEVREGTDSKDFERQHMELKKIDQFCFVVFYSSEFKLKTLSVAGEDEIFNKDWDVTELSQGYVYFSVCFIIWSLALCRDECDAWVRALRHVMHPNNFGSHLLTHRYVL